MVAPLVRLVILLEMIVKKLYNSLILTSSFARVVGKGI